MSFVFTGGKSSKSESKLIGRGTVAAIRGSYEDTPTGRFESAFKAIGETRITDPDVEARLKRYRDSIPFVAKRSNQSYLAAGLIAWHLLGEPTIDQLDESVINSPTTKVEEHMKQQVTKTSPEKPSSKRKGKIAKRNTNIDSDTYNKVVDPILKMLLEHIRLISKRKDILDVQVIKPNLTLFRYICNIATEASRIGTCQQ